MPAIFVIRLPAHAGDDAESALVVDDGAVQGDVEQGPLEAVAGRADGHKVYVIVPGGDVLLTETNVPMRGTARILQAVPYALEEQLAADVTDLHFAIGKRTPAGNIPVAAVDRARMDAWLARLNEHGLHPHAVVAETALVPPADDATVVLLEGDEAIVRGAGHTPVECTADDLEQVLDVAGVVVGDAEGTSTAKIVVYVSDEDRERHAGLIDRLSARAAQVDVRSTEGHALRVLAPGALRSDVLNLLQGQYAPRTAIDTLWRQWRTAAMLLAAFLVVTLGLQAVRLLQLRAREAHLDAAMYEILSTACGVRAVADARAQMQRCLDSRTGGATAAGDDAFLEMLGTLAAAMAETPGTKVQQLNFRNRTLDLRLTVPDIDTLERIKTLVADRGGLQMTIAQTRPGDGVVESQIELKKAGA